MATNVAEVRLWGRTIGAVSWDSKTEVATFQYEGEFSQTTFELSPFTMPLTDTPYSFPNLAKDTFKGMPGLLADSLPDDFGNAVIDTWLAQQGRNKSSFTPLERLCYVGTRGMGALEYRPSQGPKQRKARKLNLDALVDLASKIMTNRESLAVELGEGQEEEALQEILQVGTSAGGARAKAVIAWNPETDEIRSGQVDTDEGFSHWILKFDGVKNNRDRELADPEGYGLIEYAYYLMAKEAGIEMTQCRLLKEEGRAHFMTRRFDREENNLKLHLQSYGALKHYDYRKPGAYSYEEVFRTIADLGLSMDVIEQQFKRMAFNIIGRNQDDHVKNISFLMHPSGEWKLSPAYDVTYSYNPSGDWTSQHQMTLNSKQDGFTLEDFEACGKNISLAKNRAKEIVEEVTECVRQWEEFADKAGVSSKDSRRIGKAHRLELVP